MRNDILISKAPVRLDLSGGYTDIRPYCDLYIGKSLNFSIQKYTTAILKKRPDNRIRLISIDKGMIIEYQDPLFDTEFLLIKNLISRFNFKTGFDLIITCDVHFGTGLGTSASLAVALTGLFFKLKKRTINRVKIAEFAAQLERESGIAGGKQDQYASAFGGMRYYQFYKDHVDLSSPKINPEKARFLLKHLLLVHPGGSRKSNLLVDKIMEEFSGGNAVVTAQLHCINSIIDSLSNDIKEKQIKKAGAKLKSICSFQENLNKDMFDAHVKKTIAALYYSGIWGAKLTGGGGSGACIIVLLDPLLKTKITKKIEKAGFSVLQTKLDHRGLTIHRAQQLPLKIRKTLDILYAQRLN